MSLLIIGLAVLGLFIYTSGWFAQASPKALVKAGKRFGIGLLIVLGLGLLVTGKLGPAIIALAAAAGWALRLMTIHSFVQAMRQRFTQSSASRPGGPRTQDTTMTREEALSVLGLNADATDEDVKAAYRRLMAGLHPDRGGSDFLAAQINRARDVLVRK